MKCKMELIPGLPRKELIEKIHFYHRQGEVAERALGFYLLDMERRREQGATFPRASHWAKKKLGMKRADKLIRASRCLEKLPAIAGAFSRGEISWTKVRDMTRVATSQSEGQWLEFARNHSSEEVEKAVVRAKRGGLPGAGLGISRPTRLVRFPLTAERHARWEMAIRKVRHEQGRGTTPADAAICMADLVLGTEPLDPEEKGTDGETTAPRRRERGEPHFVVVYHVSPDGKSAWIDAADGRVEVDPGKIPQKVRAGAKAIEVKDVALRGTFRAIRFGQRGKAAKEERDKAVSPEMRAAALARDGYRCVLCRRTRDVEVHHLEPLADGGLSELECLASLCSPCHGAGHAQELILRIEDDGKFTALDRDGKELGREESAAEVLAEVGEDCPLETIEIREAAGKEAPGGIQACAPSEFAAREATPPEGSPGGAASAEAAVVPGEPIGAPAPLAAEEALSFVVLLDELPAELTASQWRSLEARLEWSPSHGAFLLRAQAEDLDLSERTVSSLSDATGEAKPAERAREVSPTRPRSFQDLVGQSRVVENLLLAARAAAARGEPLGHALLSGPAGLGKTTIARLLAAECGASFQEVVAGNIADPHQLISILARLEKGSFVFVDEIHALKCSCAELLYPALEDGIVQVLVRQGGRTRLLRVHLEPFTLVGATTRLGALEAPFRARFPLKERLEPYSENELADLVERAAQRLGDPASPEAARAIARRSRGTPREAIRLLERARDVAQVTAMTEARAKAEASAEAQASSTSKGSTASQGSTMSQVDGDPSTILARTGHFSDVSLSATTSQNINISLRSETTCETYGNGERPARVGDAEPRESVSGGEVLPPQAPQNAAPLHASESVAVRGTTGASNPPQDRAHAGAITQVAKDADPVLARTGRESSSSPDATTSPVLKNSEAIQESGATHGNGEATSRAADPAASGANEAHLIEAAHVTEAARRAGIDKRGLNREERKIVRLLLRRGKPVGLEAIASRLGLDVETLRDVHEPFLERQGLVERTERGRVATEKAWRIYGAAGKDRSSGSSGSKPESAFRGIPVLAFPRLGG
jgi:Holliday junction DNA helicase RuvB subunit